MAGDNLHKLHEGWTPLPLVAKCDYETYSGIVETYALQNVTNRILTVKSSVYELIRELEWKIITVDDRYILEVTGTVDDLLILRLTSSLEIYNRIAV